MDKKIIILFGLILSVGIVSALLPKLTSPTTSTGVSSISCTAITGGSDPDYCIDTSGGTPDWLTITNIPSGFVDNIDNDSFVTNYSTFLTHITFSQAMNGTLAWMSNLTNYALLTTLNNGSYLNVAYDDTWINRTFWNITWSDKNHTDFNNSNNNYIVVVNTSMKNYCDSLNTSNNNYITWANTTVYQILNNGSYLGGGLPTRVNNVSCGTGFKVLSYDNVTGNFVCDVDLTGAGTLKVNNQTCTGTDKISSYDNVTGNFVCKTDFTNDTLTEWMNISRTNFTTRETAGMTIITDLNTTLVLSANTNYTFDCMIGFTSNTTTTGFAVSMISATAPTWISYKAEIPVAADGTGGDFQGYGTASNDTIVGTGVEAVNTRYIAEVDGIVWNGAVKNAVVPAFRSEVVRMIVNATTGSFCRWTQLNG